MVLPAAVPPVLAQFVPTASGPIIGKLLLFFLKAGSPTFGQRPRHRAIPRAGIGAAIRLARPTTIPHRSRDRRDQPWAGRDHRDVCRLSRRLLLGLHRLDHRNLPAIFSVRADRSAPARAEPWQPECAGICKRRLRRGDRNHFGRLHSARPHRDRRLAHGPGWARVSRRVVSLERQPIPCSSPRPRSLA
jgi:hypothetical protein